MKIVRGFVLAVFVGLPGVTWGSPGNAEYTGIHNVGIISAVGDRFALTKIGTTIFENGEHEFPIAEWGIDDMLVKEVALAVADRFTVKPVTADPSDVEGLQNGADLTRYIVSLPQANDVDAYIIIQKDVCAGTCNGTGVPLTGLGMARRSMFFVSRYILYAFFYVTVVDARSGKVIDYGTAKTSTNFLTQSAPLENIDSSLWSETAADITELQRRVLKDKLVALLNTGLNVALKSAKLK